MTFAPQQHFHEDGKAIGSMLRNIRKARGISLRDVEEATGISNAYLSQLETGKITKPSYDTVMKLNQFIATPVPEKKPHCPVCASEDIKDVSMWGGAKFDMNTPIGTRLPPKHKTFDAMCCNTCGVLFRLNTN